VVPGEGVVKNTERRNSFLRDALLRAKIEIVEPTEPTTDLVQGKIGAVSFSWGNGYWVAKGRVPIELARLLHEDPGSRWSVRAGGHGNAPPPDEYGVKWFGADDVEIAPMTEAEEAELRAFFARHKWEIDFRIVRSLDDVPERRGFVDCYHVDDLLGLRLLADALHAQIAREKHPEIVGGVS
jgi:hypothetical protein